VLGVAVDRMLDTLPARPGLLFGGHSEGSRRAAIRASLKRRPRSAAGQMLDLRAELTRESGYQKFFVIKRTVNSEVPTHYICGLHVLRWRWGMPPLVAPPRTETVPAAQGCQSRC